MSKPHHTAIAFADIAASARLYRELGDAAASDVSRAFAARARELLPRYDGRLVKALGDGVMCAFSGAEQAVLAMGALHAAIAATPAEGSAIKLHTGISVGPVIAHGDDLYGTVVNVAAYLAATARAEQILVTQGVVDTLSLATAGSARAVYTTRLKGDERDSTIYEILWQIDPGEVTLRNVVGAPPAGAAAGGAVGGGPGAGGSLRHAHDRSHATAGAPRPRWEQRSRRRRSARVAAARDDRARRGARAPRRRERERHLRAVRWLGGGDPSRLRRDAAPRLRPDQPRPLSHRSARAADRVPARPAGALPSLA
jgi:class 3 adenylate cyclase